MIIFSMNLLSIKDVAKKLGVSARRVNQLIDEKKLPAQKIGSQYVINEGDLEKVTIYGKAGRPKKILESAQKDDAQLEKSEIDKIGVISVEKKSG